MRPTWLVPFEVTALAALLPVDAKTTIMLHALQLHHERSVQLVFWLGTAI